MRTLTLLLIALALAAPARADTFVYISLAKEKKIAVHQLDPTSGKLTHVADATCEGEPAALVVNPPRTALFASLRPEGKLSAFRIDQATGKLTHLNTIDAGADPAHLSTDTYGRFLLAAYYVAAKATVHAIEKDGTLREKPVESVFTAEKAHCIMLDPTNRFVFVPHTGPNAIFQFAFDKTTGKLSPGKPSKLATPAKTGPRHIVFHPRMDVAYVDNEQGGSVTAYKFDKSAGILAPLQTVSTLPTDFRDTNACAEIKIHPNGKWVFVSNRGHDSIARFSVDDVTGRLTMLGITPTEKTPRSFDLDFPGRFLLAAGESSGKLAVYQVDVDSGDLKPAATYTVGATPWWVLVVRTVR
jgi:6-phosphogluconolactonase